MIFKKISRPQKSEAELIRLYQDSEDLSYLADLFNRYIHLVYGSCLKYLKNEDDAQDAAMVIFEGLDEKLKKYQVDYFKSWLYSLTRNHCLMLLRKKNIVDRIDNFEKISESSVENAETMHHINEEDE